MVIFSAIVYGWLQICDVHTGSYMVQVWLCACTKSVCLSLLRCVGCSRHWRLCCAGTFCLSCSFCKIEASVIAYHKFSSTLHPYVNNWVDCLVLHVFISASCEHWSAHPLLMVIFSAIVYGWLQICARIWDPYRSWAFGDSNLRPLSKFGLPRYRWPP